MLEDITKCIEDILQPILDEANAEVFGLKVSNQNKALVIELLVDKVNGGITSDECASINKMISNVIDELEILSEGYVLNVFSPGVDKPLEGRKDFRRVIGREVRFHLIEKISGKVEHSGIIKEALDEEVIIIVKADDLVIPYKLINKAVQII